MTDHPLTTQETNAIAKILNQKTRHPYKLEPWEHDHIVDEFFRAHPELQNSLPLDENGNIAPATTRGEALIHRLLALAVTKVYEQSPQSAYLVHLALTLNRIRQYQGSGYILDSLTLSQVTAEMTDNLQLLQSQIQKGKEPDVLLRAIAHDHAKPLSKLVSEREPFDETNADMVLLGKKQYEYFLQQMKVDGYMDHDRNGNKIFNSKALSDDLHSHLMRNMDMTGEDFRKIAKRYTQFIPERDSVNEACESLASIELILGFRGERGGGSGGERSRPRAR